MFQSGIGCSRESVLCDKNAEWNIYLKEIEKFARNNASLNIIICEYNK